MAGDWIKMRIGIETDPAVFAIASRLKLDRFAVVGRLSAFWGWMNQHSEDGSVTLAGNVTGNASGNVTGNAPDNATADSCGIIDTITGVSGFAEALQSVGWLIFTRAGFEIPSYDRYNRSSAKTRSANAIRQARYKEKQRAAKAASPPPQTDGNALPNVTSNASVTPPVTLPVTDENASREEKRREENNTKNSSEPPQAAASKLAGSDQVKTEDAKTTATTSKVEYPDKPDGTVLTFKTVGDVKLWHLTQSQIQEWATLFPDMDILACCREAWAWVDAKSSNRKTASGMKSFLTKWITRKVDSGSHRKPTPTAPPPKKKYFGDDPEVDF